MEFFFTRKSFVKLFLLDFNKEFPYKLIRNHQQEILQKNPLKIWYGFILQRIPLEKIFYREILCKIFPNFQT